MDQRIPQKSWAWARAGFLGVALFLLSGCGTVSLQRSFDNYSDVYAETQNRQMLLNLARLSDREPIYFFQLAQISAGYTFTETAGLQAVKGGTSQSSPTLPIPLFTHTNTASLGATATHNPVFTMIPLGGDKFAQQLLAPIKPAIFYELYEEGWPIDLLMRVLIERIELVKDVPADEGGAADAADPRAGEGLEVMVNDPLASEGGHFDRFLRACALAREFQRKGILYLDISDEFQPLSQTGFLSPPSDQQQMNAEKEGLVWRQNSPGDPIAFPRIARSPGEAGARSAQGDAADESGERNRPGGAGGPAEHASQALASGTYWQLGKTVKQTLFKLNYARLDQAKDSLEKNEDFRGNDGLIEKFYVVLKNGIGVTDTDTAKNPYKVRLVMRSLLGSMLALANEQRNFGALDAFRDQVEQRGVWQKIDDAQRELKATGKPETLTAADEQTWKKANPDAEKAWEAASQRLESLIDENVDTVPPSEDHPVLVLNWPADYSTRAAISLDPAVSRPAVPNARFPMDPGSEVVTVAYKGKVYTIGDGAGNEVPALATWNRDIFRLLVQLSLQVTADPSSFALPSLLQSH